MSGDRARVTVLVKVPPATAFAIFTDEIDLWWRRGPKFRAGGKLHLEPRLGGKLVEETGERSFEVGEVTAWDPPAHLRLDWRIRNFAPGEKTEVEIWFEASPSGTRVTVEHRGWDGLRADHPARHGLAGRALSHMIGLWWGDLLTSLREQVNSRLVDSNE